MPPKQTATRTICRYFPSRASSSLSIWHFRTRSLGLALLLCNDRDVLGPWTNRTRTNVFAGIVVWILVLLSVILTASVLFPHIGRNAILSVLGGGAFLGVGLGLVLAWQARSARRRARRADVLGALLGDSGPEKQSDVSMSRESWRMPPLDELPSPSLSTQRKIGLVVLRAYLLLAMAMVVVKIVTVSLK